MAIVIGCRKEEERRGRGREGELWQQLAAAATGLARWRTQRVGAARWAADGIDKKEGTILVFIS